MMPGWNQMRQPGPHMQMNRNPSMMGGGNMMMGGGNPMMGNYGMNQPYPMHGGQMMYQQPYMQQPMYPQSMMMPNMGHPQMNQQQQQPQQIAPRAPLPVNAPDQPPPPAPCEPPPNSSAPLPPVDEKKSSSQPPPPDSAKEWWKSELENLSGSSQQELLVLTKTDWFLDMTTNQQIEYWQHKMQLKSMQEGQGDSNQSYSVKKDTSPTKKNQDQLSKSGSMSDPAKSNDQDVAPEWDKSSGENPHDALKRYQSQLTKLKEQAEVFEKQYTDWRKQFDEWKEKHRNHPNKTQFNQYEKQWVTWQKQMLEQKKQNEANKEKLLENVKKIEETIEEEKKQKEQAEKMKYQQNNPQTSGSQGSYNQSMERQYPPANQSISNNFNYSQASFQTSGPVQQNMWGPTNNQFNQANQYSMAPRFNYDQTRPNHPSFMAGNNPNFNSGYYQNRGVDNQPWPHMPPNQPRMPPYPQLRPSMPENTFQNNMQMSNRYPAPQRPRNEYDANGNLINSQDPVYPNSKQQDNFSQQSTLNDNQHGNSWENKTNSGGNSQQFTNSSQQQPRFSGPLYEQKTASTEETQEAPFASSNELEFSGDNQQNSKFLNSQQKSEYTDEFQQQENFSIKSQSMAMASGNAQQRPRFPGDNQPRQQFTSSNQAMEKYSEDNNTMEMFLGDKQDGPRFSGDTQPRQRFPGDSQPRQRFPGDNQPRQRFPGDNLPRQRFPGDNQPRQRFPGDNQPRQRFPGDNQPRQRFPGDNQVRQRFPGDNQPRQRFPGDNQPRQRFPGDNQTRQRFPGDNQPRQRFPGDIQPRQRFPGDNQPRQRFPGDNQARQRFPGDNQARQRFSGDNQPRQRFPGDNQPRPRFSGDNQPRQRFPGDNQIRQRFPGDNQPRQRFPGDNQPRQRFPGDDQPRQRFPGDDQPRQRFLGDDQPRQRFPGDNQPRQRFPGDDQPRQRFPEDNQTRQRFPGDNQPRQRFPGDNQARQKFPRDNQPRQRFPGDNQARQRFPGDNQVRQRFPGDNKARQRFPGDNQPRQRFPGDNQPRQRFSGDGPARQKFPDDQQANSKFFSDTPQRPRQRYSENLQQHQRHPANATQRQRFPGDMPNQRFSHAENTRQRPRLSVESQEEKEFHHDEKEAEATVEKPKQPAADSTAETDVDYAKDDDYNVWDKVEQIPSNSESSQSTKNKERDSRRSFSPPKGKFAVRDGPRFEGPHRTPRFPTRGPAPRPDFALNEFGDNYVVIEDEFDSRPSQGPRPRFPHQPPARRPPPKFNDNFSQQRYPGDSSRRHDDGKRRRWSDDKPIPSNQSQSNNPEGTSLNNDIDLDDARKLVESNPLFSEENMKKLQEQLKLITQQNKLQAQVQDNRTPETDRDANARPMDKGKILEKARNLSSADLKNILAAVKMASAQKPSETEQGRGGGRYGDTSRSDIKRDSSKAHGNPADSTYPQGEVDPLLDSLEALAAAGALDDDDLLQEYLRADPRLEEELYYRAIHDRNLLEEARRIGGDLDWHEEPVQEFSFSRRDSKGFADSTRYDDDRRERGSTDRFSLDRRRDSPPLRDFVYPPRDDERREERSFKDRYDRPGDERPPFDDFGARRRSPIRDLRDANQRDLERRSIERRHQAINRDLQSVKQQRANLDSVFIYDERDEERMRRERSLERLRACEAELLDREQAILARERALRDALHQYSPSRKRPYDEEGRGRGLQGESRRGPPEGMRRGPHDDMGGPPDEMRRRPPNDMRRGPPEDVRRNTHDGMRVGPPDGMRRGPHDEVRRGPYDEMRGGPSDGMRRGPPDDKRGGPPDSMRRGPPDDKRGRPSDNMRRGPPDDKRGGPPDARRRPLDEREPNRFGFPGRGRSSPGRDLGPDRFRSGEQLPPRDREFRDERDRVRRRSQSPRREEQRRREVMDRNRPSPARRRSPPRKMRRSRSRSPAARGDKDEFGRDLKYRGRGLLEHVASPRHHEPSPRRDPAKVDDNNPVSDEKDISTLIPDITPFSDLQELPEPPPKLPPAPLLLNIEDIIKMPGRLKRPSKIVIILRGLPGCGKTHIAKMIRDKENTFKVSPRMLSLDDYFMAEVEKTIKDPDTGKSTKKRVLEYEYEEDMEESYRGNLVRSFKKTLEHGYFTFVIMDAVNDKVDYFGDCYNSAKAAGFEVYIAEISADVHECARRNVHGRTLADIQTLSENWEKTPSYMNKVDVRQLLQDSSIQEVEMGDITESEDESEKKLKEKEEEESSAPSSQEVGVPKSKWETESAAAQLDKLDGIHKKKTMKQSMEDFLSVTDDYNARQSAPGKKRVRWADINERQNQQRMRDVGFVVGQTDWSRMMDDSHATQALNRTKFI